jgi:hypothetical protein
MRPPVRLLIIALSGAAGYFAVSAITAAGGPALATTAQANASAIPPAGMITGKLEDSALVAEWEALRNTHGKTPADFPDLYDKIKKLEDPFRRRAFRAAALAEWAAGDPVAALRYLREKDKYMVTQFLREWLRRDPDGAITALLGEKKVTYDGFADILREIAKVAKLPKSDSRWASEPQSAFALFAAKDPAGARAAAEALTGPWRTQALAGVAAAWGEKDGSGALTWAQALPPGEARDAALKAVLTGWAKLDPLGALAHLDLAPPGGDEMYFASDTAARVLAEAGKKDWKATMEWLRDNPGKIGRNSFDGLQNAFSKRLNADPAAAMREIFTSGVPGLSNVFGNSILNDGYAQHDAVWHWLEGQPKNMETDLLRGNLINAMAYKEPDVAMEFLGKLPVTADNKELFDRAAQSIINGGSRIGRLDDLLDKAPPSLRPSILEYGLMYGRDAVGADAEHWVTKLDELPKGKRENAISGLARGWAANDPDAAVKWALTLPENDERTSAFGAITSVWAVHDTEATAAFVESLPEGKDRETGKQSIAYALLKDHPSEAWDWALDLKESTMRLNALHLIYSQLAVKSPAAAADLLQGANLPPEQVKTFQVPQAAPGATTPLLR